MNSQPRDSTRVKVFPAVAKDSNYLGESSPFFFVSFEKSEADVSWFSAFL